MTKFVEMPPIVNEDELDRLVGLIQAKVARNKKYEEVYDTEPRNAIYYALESSRCPEPEFDPGWWEMYSKQGDRRVGQVVRQTIKKVARLRAKYIKGLNRI